MQTKPTNWDNYLAQEHTVESKIVVGGTEYNQSKIKSISITGSLYDTFGIGNCCARTCEIEFYPTVEPVRQAKVEVYCSLKTRNLLPKWDKKRVRTTWNIQQSASLRAYRLEQTIRGYKNYKVRYVSQTDTYYVVGDGEESSLSWTQQNPTTQEAIEEFIEEYPYWYDGKSFDQLMYFGFTSVVVSGPLNVTIASTTYDGTYSAGEVIGSVFSDNENAYPNNGIQDGYWYTRNGIGIASTDYIKKGTYYISKREKKPNGLLKVTCYDSMLRTEDTYLTSSMDVDDFPKACSTVVDEIALRIFGESGHTEETTYWANYQVQYPVDADGDMTMRELLSRIAIANAGNWIISDDNKLILVPLNSIPTETNLMITFDGEPIVIGTDSGVDVRLII